MEAAEPMKALPSVKFTAASRSFQTALVGKHFSSHLPCDSQQAESKQAQGSRFGSCRQVGVTGRDVHNPLGELSHCGMEGLSGGAGRHSSVRQLPGETASKLKGEA